MQSQSQNNTMERNGDKLTSVNKQAVQNNKDVKMVKTVTPDNDNGKPGKPSQQKSNVNPPQFQEDSSSNKGQGPAGENL